jgi:hypothetical protein
MLVLIILAVILTLLLGFGALMAHTNSESTREYRRANWES